MSDGVRGSDVRGQWGVVRQTGGGVESGGVREVVRGNGVWWVEGEC